MPFRFVDSSHYHSLVLTISAKLREQLKRPLHASEIEQIAQIAGVIAQKKPNAAVVSVAYLNERIEVVTTKAPCVSESEEFSLTE